MPSLFLIGKTYAAPSFTETAADYLADWYPSKLSDFKNSQRRVGRDLDFGGLPPSNLHIMAVVLARKYNVPDSLPAALYHCAQLPLDKILDGGFATDGDDETQSKGDDEFSAIVK